MKTILNLLNLVVQFLRLVLSACIVIPTVLFFTNLDRYSFSNLKFFLLSLPVFIFWVLAFIALNRIMPITKRCQEGDYFAESNLSSVRFLSYLLIVYALERPALEFIFKSIEQGRFELSYVFDIDINHAFYKSIGFGYDFDVTVQNH